MSVMELAFSPRKIKQRREGLRLTQQQLADKLGYDSNTYAHKERGERPMRADELVHICYLLGIVRLDEIVEHKKK